MRPSRAVPGSCLDASTASRRTTGAQAVPSTLTPWWWGGSNPRPTYHLARYPASPLPHWPCPSRRPLGRKFAVTLITAAAVSAGAASCIHARTVQGHTHPSTVLAAWLHRDSRGPSVAALRQGLGAPARCLRGPSSPPPRPGRGATLHVLYVQHPLGLHPSLLVICIGRRHIVCVATPALHILSLPWHQLCSPRAVMILPLVTTPVLI